MTVITPSFQHYTGGLSEVSEFRKKKKPIRTGNKEIKLYYLQRYNYINLTNVYSKSAGYKVYKIYFVYISNKELQNEILKR